MVRKPRNALKSDPRRGHVSARPDTLRTGGAMTVSRRGFMGGFAATLGYIGVAPELDLFAQNRVQAPAGAAARAPRDDYDMMAHLSSNENCWGPPESVMKAMNNAWKYSNRYGYPDGNLVS